MRHPDRKEATEAKIAELCAAIDCKPERAVAMLSKNPHIMQLPPADLQARVDSITALLACETHQTQAMLRSSRAKSTGLLTMGMEAIKEKMDYLQQLGLSQAEAGRALLVTEPTIITLEMPQLKQRVEALQKILLRTPWVVEDMLAACPELMSVKVGLVYRNMCIIQQAASSHAAWRSEWNSLSAATAGRMLTALVRRTQRLEEAVKLRCQGEYSMVELCEMGDSQWQEIRRKLMPPGKRKAQWAAADAAGFDNGWWDEE